MRQRTATVVAVASAATTFGLMASAYVFAYLNHDLNVVTSQVGPDLVAPFGLALVGLIVATRQRSNPIGWLFVVGSLLGALHAFTSEYTLHGLLAAPTLPALPWVAWLSNWIIMPLFPGGIVLFILLLFPSGGLISPRWRILAAAGLLYSGLMLAATLLSDYPITVAPGVRTMAPPIALKGFSSSIFGYLWYIWPAGFLLLLFAGASLVIRYRRSTGDERQQVKWFAFAAAATVVAYAAGIPFSFSSPFANAFSNVVIEIGFGVALPVACGIAILKYRLYGIDVVINRTLVYGALAVLITGVYVGIAVGIGTLVGSGGRPNLGLSILATAIVAIGFQPVRVRLQRLANRLVYGARATPYELLSEFSERVAETYAADEVLPRMARVLQEGTGAAAAAVWVRSGEQLRPAATYPESANGLHPVTLVGAEVPDIEGVQRTVPVLHQGDLLGALTITKRRGETLTPIEEKLLDDLAHQAGLVLKNVGLTAELLQRLDELRASRQRLVAAQDDERRRLERNLHDGAQQHLVALKVKLGLAEMLLQRDAEKARATVVQLKADADEALETLRDLARGIYPPVLEERGLVAALQAQARKATVPITVDAGAIQRHTQAQEAAVYFCVLEALQNVQKYAGATLATIRIAEMDSMLRFEVEDDGAGFDVPTVRRGSGLTNMADRLDALGGHLEIHSRPGHGCRLVGSVPVGAPVPA